MALLDYRLTVFNSVFDYVQINDYSVIQDDVPHLAKLTFTNARIGGCQGAEITLAGKPGLLSGDFWGALGPDGSVSIEVKATGDSALKRRYHGAIQSVRMAEGTDPNTMVIRCVGGMSILNKTLGMLYLDDVTPLQAMQAIATHIGTQQINQLVASANTLMTYDPVYTIQQVDFLDVSVGRMLELINEVGGADAIYGVAPNTINNTLDWAQGMVYFAQMSGTAIDLGFEVGTSKTVESATRTLTNADEINGVLVTCQRKIGGGNLFLYVKPTVSGRAWRWDKIQLPEVVDAADAYRYGGLYCDAREGDTETIAFEVPGYGKQVWTNEVMNAPLKVALTEGGADYSIWPDSYTLTIEGNGAVNTKFVLGKRPDWSMLASKDWANTMRDIVVAKTQELWSGAELAAMNRDIVREWRRTAGKDFDIRNFWAASFDSIDSAVPLEEVGSLDVLPPSAWDQTWDYEYKPDRQTIDNAGNPEWRILSCFIPTGLAAQKAVVFVDNVGSIIPYDSRYIYDREWSVSGGSVIFENDTQYGHTVRFVPLLSMAYQAFSYVSYVFSTGLPESPVTIKVARPVRSADATDPEDFADMAALACYTDVCFGFEGNYFTDYYCIRLFRNNLTTDTPVHVTAGWVEHTGWSEGTLNEDHWSDAGTSPFDSFSVGTDDANGWNEDHPYLRIVCTMPEETGDPWTVTIYDGDTDSVLWTFTQDVDIGVSDAWSVVGNHIAGMCWKDYFYNGSEYALIHGIKEIAFSGSATLPVGVTRNGTTWVTGNAGALLSPGGATAWDDGTVGIRIAVKGGVNDEMSAWGAGFLLADEV